MPSHDGEELVTRRCPFAGHRERINIHGVMRMICPRRPITCRFSIQTVLSFFLCHLLEHRNLSEEFSFWLSGASKHSGASSYVRNQARLRCDFGALPDPKMPGHGCLPPDANEILKHG